MGHIDDYLRTHVTPRLLPGEQILGFGLVRKPSKINALGVPQKYDEWLATSTNERLILFATEASGVLELTPKPMCREVHEWWYRELKEVTLGQVSGVGGGVHFGLVPHETLGPLKGQARRYDMFPVVHGLDGHAEFFQRFAPWLQQQVAAGAYPLDDATRERIAAMKQQQAEAERLAAAQAAERAAQRAEQRKQTQAALKRALSPIGPFALAIVLVVLGVGALGTAGYCLYTVADGSPRLERLKRELREKRDELDSVPDEKLTAAKYFVKSLETSHENLTESLAEHTLVGYASGGATLLFLGGGVASFVVWRRKNRAAKAVT